MYSGSECITLFLF